MNAVNNVVKAVMTDNFPECEIDYGYRVVVEGAGDKAAKFEARMRYQAELELEEMGMLWEVNRVQGSLTQVLVVEDGKGRKVVEVEFLGGWTEQGYDNGKYERRLTTALHKAVTLVKEKQVHELMMKQKMAARKAAEAAAAKFK